jgi:hypothetical protein
LGMDAVIDLAGDPIASIDGMSFLPTPPLSVLLDQELIEGQTTADAVTKKTVHMHQSQYSFVVSVSEDFLRIVPLEISVLVYSPSTPPTRVAVSSSQFKCVHNEINGDNIAPPAKRAKLEIAHGGRDTSSSESFMEEVTKFASILTATIDPEAR